VTAPTRLAAFGLGLVALFAAALGVGRLVGPVAAEPAAAGGAGHAEAAADRGPAAAAPGGLQVSERGYTLQLSAPTAPAGPSTLAFRVLGRDGRPVTAYQVSHEKELHLIVVRRDLSGYRHLHPTRDAAGTWTARVDLRPGAYRVLADFQPAGEPEALTLGADLTVPGTVRPRVLPAPAGQTVVDDYPVTLTGTLRPGAVSRLSFAVSRSGRPVTDLQPYLGAAGHLVALRAGDLAYLHVHPAGDGLSFDVEVPSPGTYRLYLEFQHGGKVRTAELTAVAGGVMAPPPTPEPGRSGGGHGDDGHGD
jgi:hypothetical protein